MVKFEWRVFPKELREELGEFIPMIEALASISYEDLLEMEKERNRPLNRMEIASSLDKYIQSTLAVLQQERVIIGLREKLIDYYYRERKEPYTV